MKLSRISILCLAAAALLAAAGQTQVNDVSPMFSTGSEAKDGSRCFFTGELLYTLNVGTITGDIRCLGVEFDDDDNWWITGAADMLGAKLYKISYGGTLLGTYNQGKTGWGWRDLAYDGRYLYASDSYVIDQIDPATGMVTGVTIPSPVTPARALAYEAPSDSFWTASFSSSIYSIKRDGTFSAYANPGLMVYGMAMDDAARTLWIWSQDGSGCMASAFDTVTGTFTGQSWDGDIGLAGIAGGACIFEDPGYGRMVMAGLQQASPDVVAVYGSAVAGTGTLYATGYSNGRKIVRDGSGFYHVVYAASTGSWPAMPVVEYCRSSNMFGAAWTKPVQVSAAQGNDPSPALAVDRDDNLHLVWHDDDYQAQSEIWYRKFDHASQSWLNPVMVSNLPATDSVSPSVDCDNNGVIHVVWQEAACSPQSEIFYAMSSNGGLTFSAAVMVSIADLGESARPRVACPADWSTGHAHVVWHEARQGSGLQVYHSATPDNGLNWMAETPVSQTAPGVLDTAGLFPSLVVDGTDNPRVAYSQGNALGGVFYNRSFDAGMTFGSRVQVAATADGFPEPSLALDSHGVLRLLWHDGTAGARSLHYAYREPGLGLWSAPFPITADDYHLASTVYKNRLVRGGYAVATDGDAEPTRIRRVPCPKAVVKLTNTPATAKRGQTVKWKAFVANQTRIAYNLATDVWIEVTAPAPPAPFSRLYVTVPSLPLGLSSGTMSVYIPTTVPTGTYDMSVVTGIMGSEDWDRDFFRMAVTP